MHQGAALRVAVHVPAHSLRRFSKTAKSAFTDSYLFYISFWALRMRSNLASAAVLPSATAHVTGSLRDKKSRSVVSLNTLSSNASTPCAEAPTGACRLTFSPHAVFIFIASEYCENGPILLVNIPLFFCDSANTTQGQAEYVVGVLENLSDGLSIRIAYHVVIHS